MKYLVGIVIVVYCLTKLNHVTATHLLPNLLTDKFFVLILIFYLLGFLHTIFLLAERQNVFSIFRGINNSLRPLRPTERRQKTS